MREIASLIQALVLMCNSWQESENKSFWCADAWAKKREAAAKLRRPITRAIPTWLSVTGVKQQAGRLDWSDAKFTVIEERAALIRDIYKKRAQGCGIHSITSWLNKQNIPSWNTNKQNNSNRWNHIYICKILHTRTVLGEFQPCKLNTGRYSTPIAAGDPIPNYFPRIVPDDLWLAAQYFNGKPKQHPGRPSLALSAGLAIDPDGAPMYLGHHSKNQRYLATSFSFRHENKTIWRWQLAHLEQCLLLIVQKINWQKALSNPDDEPQLLKLRGQLGEIAQQEQTIKTRLQHAAKILLTDLGALNDEIKTQAVALTSQQALLSEKHRETIHKINQLEVSTKPPLEITKFSLEDFQKNNLTPEVREQFRRQLRNLLKKITLYPDGNIPGFPTNAIRIKAASHASGTSGRLPKPEERIFGAIRLLTVSNQDLIFWVTYPAIITKNQVPVILATYGEDSFLKK
ncbi:recombinase family protein [Termitidicoccus mucosus]